MRSRSTVYQNSHISDCSNPQRQETNSKQKNLKDSHASTVK